MALVLADRVLETTTTTGSGTITLLGATEGYQSFAVVGDGNTTYYTIAGQSGSEWEVGIGTYTASGTTLSRDTVLSSSNSNDKVTFSAGTKDVFVTYPASKSVNQDASGNVEVSGTISGVALLATNGIVLNNDSSASNYTFPTNYNGLTVGPHTISAGVSITVSAGQRWVVI